MEGWKISMSGMQHIHSLRGSVDQWHVRSTAPGELEVVYVLLVE